jgi:hypothetical protein
MDVFFKSSMTWLLLVAVLLGSIVRSHENAAEGSKSQTDGRGLTDQPGIVNLDFSWQGLMSVPAISPGQLVHTLDLSHNNLHNLYNGNFYPYPNLTKLILSSDNITSIEDKTFSNLQALTEVDLSYNSLTFINPSMFVLNTNLQILSLQGNPLYTLKPGTPFLIATSLRSLDLSHCHLLQFSTESLSGLPELKILDLRQNNLRQLSVNSISALSSLKLSGNPWQCDCLFHALLIWVSTNQEMDSDIRTDNTVQCWLGDKLRDLITKKDWDSICMEATGLPTDQKITPEFSVTGSNEDHAILDKNNDSAFPANNKDDDDYGDGDNGIDEWLYDDYYQEILNFDDNDYEDLDANISLSAGEFPNSVRQDYTGLNLTVSTEVGDKHNELTRKYELTNSTTHVLRLDNNFIPEHNDISSHGEFSGGYEDSEEFDSDNISLLSAEIPSLDHEDSDLTVNMKTGDNRTEVNTRYDLIDSVTISSSADDNFVPEDVDLSFYEYEFYGAFQDSEELYNDVSVAEMPDVNSEDHTTFVDVNYTSENSNLQELHSKTKLPISTTDFSSQSNDVIMDGIASDNNSLKAPDATLTDNTKDAALSYILDYDYKCIFCDNYAVPATETQNLKHNEYEFADPFVLLEKVNSEEIVRNAEDVDSSFQFQNTYDDFNPEYIGDLVAFNFYDLDSMEITKNELSSDTINLPNTIDEENFDDNLIASLLEGHNSAPDVQERETLMNQINDKPPNGKDFKIYTIIRFLILAGMVSVVVCLLIVILYCIKKVHHSPAFPMQVNEYKKLKNSMSKNEPLLNV